MIGQRITGEQGKSFTIVREIGRGGFGVVYLAGDAEGQPRTTLSSGERQPKRDVFKLKHPRRTALRNRSRQYIPNPAHFWASNGFLFPALIRARIRARKGPKTPNFSQRHPKQEPCNPLKTLAISTSYRVQDRLRRPVLYPVELRAVVMFSITYLLALDCRAFLRSESRKVFRSTRVDLAVRTSPVFTALRP